MKTPRTAGLSPRLARALTRASTQRESGVRAAAALLGEDILSAATTPAAAGAIRRAIGAPAGTTTGAGELGVASLGGGAVRLSLPLDAAALDDAVAAVAFTPARPEAVAHLLSANASTAVQRAAVASLATLADGTWAPVFASALASSAPLIEGLSATSARVIADKAGPRLAVDLAPKERVSQPAGRRSHAENTAAMIAPLTEMLSDPVFNAAFDLAFAEAALHAIDDVNLGRTGQEYRKAPHETIVRFPYRGILVGVTLRHYDDIWHGGEFLAIDLSPPAGRGLKWGHSVLSEAAKTKAVRICADPTAPFAARVGAAAGILPNSSGENWDLVKSRDDAKEALKESGVVASIGEVIELRAGYDSSGASGDVLRIGIALPVTKLVGVRKG